MWSAKIMAEREPCEHYFGHLNTGQSILLVLCLANVLLYSSSAFSCEINSVPTDEPSTKWSPTYNHSFLMSTKFSFELLNYCCQHKYRQT